MLTCKLHPNWNLECVEFLSLSILVLNTTYHSDKIPKSLKLSKENFIKTNESYLKELTNYSMLSDIYDRIVKQQFEAKIDIQEKFFRRVNTMIDQRGSHIGSLDEVTIKGTEFLKYGRYGKPHKRLVSLDSTKASILWRDSKTPTEKPRFILTSEITEVIIGSDHTAVM
jgi:hypothetical protein